MICEPYASSKLTVVSPVWKIYSWEIEIIFCIVEADKMLLEKTAWMWIMFSYKYTIKLFC